MTRRRRERNMWICRLNKAYQGICFLVSNIHALNNKARKSIYFTYQCTEKSFKKREKMLLLSDMQQRDPSALLKSYKVQKYANARRVWMYIKFIPSHGLISASFSTPLFSSRSFSPKPRVNKTCEYSININHRARESKKAIHFHVLMTSMNLFFMAKRLQTGTTAAKRNNFFILPSFSTMWLIKLQQQKKCL